MDAVFLKLLNMSIAASWLILAVILLRQFLKKAPKWFTCILWAIVAVRLLCPVTIESTFSLIPSAETFQPSVVQYAHKPTINSGISFINSTLNPIIGEAFEPAPGASANPLHILMFIAGNLWIIGVICLLAYALVSFLRLRSKMGEAVLMRDNIWLCDNVQSPFILGIIRPQIYLGSGIGEEQMQYVLAHEQAHLKRRDHWWKPLGYLLLSVYWFNPLMWLAYVLLCRDIELACDEKVIKDMNMEGKKAYSNALVDCSVQRKMVVVCPLAFGEVGVRERVKKVLNYKKPAFWLILVAIAVCIAVTVCFLTNPKRNVFDIKIVIPAGSEEAFYYSEEEISPQKNKITLLAGEGLGDTLVVLKPVEVKEENAYDEPTYLTPGLSVKMDVEKGAWFKVGVDMSNPANEDIVVYVQVKGVDVRIADKIDSNQIESDESRNSADKLSEETESAENVTTLEAAISKAIMEKNKSSYTGEADFACCDFAILETLSATPVVGSTTHTIVCYGWELYQEFNISEYGIEETAGSHTPVVLTFELNENGYVLKEYWQPRSGSYFVEDIRDKFPAHIADDGIDSQKFICQQMQSCYKQAVLYSGLDTGTVIDGLLDIICSDPGTSSNPQDYIDAHSIEYRELLYYGEYTLRYCFKRFRQGNETGLEGKIMAIVCEELLQTKGKNPVDAGTAETGQFWFDTLLAHGGNMVEPYLP